MKKFKRTLLDEIMYYCFYSWYNLLTDLRWKIPNLIHRAYYGWGKADTWDFDIYLAKIINGGITHLKKNKNGAPVDLFEKYGDEKVIEERDKILDKIIRAFKLHLVWVDEGRILTEEEKKEYQEGLELFIKYMGDLWD
jgi:hypothetical protein